MRSCHRRWQVAGGREVIATRWRQRERHRIESISSSFFPGQGITEDNWQQEKTVSSGSDALNVVRSVFLCQDAGWRRKAVLMAACGTSWLYYLNPKPLDGKKSKSLDSRTD